MRLRRRRLEASESQGEESARAGGEAAKESGATFRRRGQAPVRAADGDEQAHGGDAVLLRNRLLMRRSHFHEILDSILNAFDVLQLVHLSVVCVSYNTHR